MLVANKDALEGRGEVAIAVPLSDIRYVRFTPPADGGQKTCRLDVTTPKRDVRLVFDDWAGDEGHQAEVALLVQLLRSTMSLPATEVPSSPLASERPAPQLDVPDDLPEVTSSGDPVG